MMVAAPGCYVDASIRLGVSLVPAQLFCMDGVAERRAPAAATASTKSVPRPVWRRRLVAAFRHPGLHAAPDRQRALQRAIAAQLGQPYNRRFIFKRVREPDADASAFCSELVARTFAGLGLPIVPERRFAAVLPHTLRRSICRGRGGSTSATTTVRACRTPRPPEPASAFQRLRQPSGRRQ